MLLIYSRGQKKFTFYIYKTIIIRSVAYYDSVTERPVINTFIYYDENAFLWHLYGFIEFRHGDGLGR